MRLAARAPPPPDLVRRRLMLQYAVCEFEICLSGFVLVLWRIFAFLVRWFSTSSLQVSCKISAGVLHCFWCLALWANTIIWSKKRCQETLEIVQNGAWKDPTSFTNHVKLDPGRFKRRLVRKVVSGRQLDSPRSFLGTSLALFGRFWAPFHSILKGGPKITLFYKRST